MNDIRCELKEVSDMGRENYLKKHENTVGAGC